MTPLEEWRPTHLPNYEVSNRGRLRSWALQGGQRQKDPTGRALHSRPLRSHISTSGYPECSLGSGRKYFVHRLVAAAFLGPCPTGQEVRHKDDDPTNSCSENLEYGTRTQNILDSVARGRWGDRSLRGSDNGNSRLSLSEVQSIRELAIEGMLNQDIAQRFAVSNATIGHIVNRKTWRHV